MIIYELAPTVSVHYICSIQHSCNQINARSSIEPLASLNLGITQLYCF